MKFLQFNFNKSRCDAIDVTQRWWMGTEMWYRVTNSSDASHSCRTIFFVCVQPFTDSCRHIFGCDLYNSNLCPLIHIYEMKSVFFAVHQFVVVKYHSMFMSQNDLLKNQEWHCPGTKTPVEILLATNQHNLKRRGVNT